MPADHTANTPRAATRGAHRDVIEGLGIRNPGEVWSDLGAEALIEHAIRRREGLLASNGALVVRTGQFTGRSPKDKFIVRNASTEASVHWGPVNQPISPENFAGVYSRALASLDGKE